MFVKNNSVNLAFDSIESRFVTASKSKLVTSHEISNNNRCVALINSKSFYNQVHNGKRKLNKDCEFEIILYVPARAWAKLHNKDEDEYYACHETPVCVETYSNEAGWQIE